MAHLPQYNHRFEIVRDNPSYAYPMLRNSSV